MFFVKIYLEYFFLKFVLPIRKRFRSFILTNFQFFS